MDIQQSVAGKVVRPPEGYHAFVPHPLPPTANVKQDPHDLQEVQNYITALEYGMRRLADLPLSLRLIKEIHEQLMQGVRGAHATPGEFRRSRPR